MSRKMLLKYLPLIVSFVLTPKMLVQAKTVNDELYPHQWSLKKIGVEQAWDYTLGLPTVVVAVIDTGIDDRHPDLKGALWTNPLEIPGNEYDDDQNGYQDDIHGWNMRSNSSSTQPIRTMHQADESYSHGTAVAALLAARANDGFGIAGVAPRVKIMPIVVLDGDGYGSSDALAEAIDYAVANGADIINVSITGLEDDDDVRAALYRAGQADILTVVAVGNSPLEEGTDVSETPIYPACSLKEEFAGAVIRVTGSDILDQKAPYANYGAHCTDLAAPGHDMVSARATDLPLGSDATTTPLHVDGITGTSAATPLVSGTAALLKSAKPNLTAKELKTLILQTSDAIEPMPQTGQKGRLGYGRLNAGKALGKAMAAEAISSWQTLWKFWFVR